ncbi:DUF3077 domain-containing protein [Oxalobacter vibrioformis]|uniref:DUF3077 domain-containing protein n=1 Tax=Oxalobacter vibrioformis TaxID=933080 RepID=A0A9E9P2C8_9BURK|nr:DUF3077 domain-containing protein [Oxalobacter vibrioformis]WAW09749.1 DUF3077 domain-containing protein [Oxalobacter vibrioformis]
MAKNHSTQNRPKAKLHQAKTTHCGFFTFNKDHPELFAVNPGVPVTVALDEAGNFVSTARNIAHSAFCNPDADSMYSIYCLLEMAMAVIETANHSLKMEVCHEQ